MISVVIIEDDQDLREGLALILNNTPNVKCRGAFESCELGLPKVLNQPPDVLLMDIDLPGMNGIEGIRQLKVDLPDLDVIIFTVYQDDQKVFESLKAGACGYLTKNTPPAKLIDAITDVHHGGSPMSANIARMVVDSFRQQPQPSPLTPRETEVLTQLCEGKSYKMIADHLDISRGTVHSHIKNIYKKLNVHSETEAVAKALKENLV